MNREPTETTAELFRLIGEIVAEKPQVAKNLAERLAGLLNAPHINVFELYGRDGDAATRKALGKMTNDQLFSVVYHFDFDPSSIPMKAAKKAALVDHIVGHLKAQFKENRLLAQG
jgi:hypothetical protein